MVSLGAQRRGREPVSCRAQTHVVAGEAPSHRTGGVRRSSREFSAYETAAIELDLSCRGEPPPAEQMSVKFILPGGELYRSVPLSPVEQNGRGPRRKTTFLLGTARLPVRGTFITQNQLYGEWRVEVCREIASQELCTNALSFELTSDPR
jgi:hypothetical protein